MSEPHLIILNDAQELYVRAAEEIAHIAGEAICTHGEFTICLSGGSTPAATYDLLATRFHLSVDWKEVQFYWGDERRRITPRAISRWQIAPCWASSR
jgi:6-phosphogluconolactonase